jgi:hypothetical protein
MLLIKTLRIIFIMIPFFSFSQEKAAIQQQFNLTLDSINNEIIYQIKDSLYFLDAESLSIINSKKIYTYNLSNYHITKKGNSLLFLEREGGDILKLDSDNKLKKIDNSNINKFFIDNFNFVRKDTLFKHGGYGYWSQSNFLTYYNKSTKQWEIYPTSKNSEVPRSADSHIGVSWNNSFTFFGGLSLTENGYRIRKNINKEVWSFNFISKKWALLGKFKDQNLYPNYINFSNQSDLYVLDKVSQLYKIDFLNNKLIKYKKNPILYNFFLETNPIYYNDFVYFINKNGKVSKVSLKEITAEIENINEFYFNKNRILIPMIIVIIISLILYSSIFIYRKKKKNLKLQLLSNGITYNNKFIEFDNLALSILKTVIKKEMEFSEVYKIVSKKHLSKIQNDRNRNEIIAHINFKLKGLTNIKSDFLIVSKSSFDKRSKILSVNRDDYSKLI